MPDPTDPAPVNPTDPASPAPGTSQPPASDATTAAGAPTDPPPGDASPAAADPPAFDTAAAAFDSVSDASAGGSTPAIDDAALQELLDLASMETPGSPAAGAPGGDDPTPFDVAAAASGMESPDASAAIDAHGFDLPSFHQVIADAAASSIDLLRDVELNVKIELGRSRMLVEEVLKLSEGSVVELDKLAGDPVDVFVNDRLVARGEVLVLNDNFCVRVNEIVAGGRDPQD